MKQFFTLFAVVLFGTTAFAQVGIGTTTPEASAALDVTSTTKGLLIPRMTDVERQAISNPAEGLMVYQTNQTAGFYFYDGNTWSQLAGPTGTDGQGGDGLVVGASEVSNISFNTATAKSFLSDTGNQIVLSKGFYADTTSPPSATTSQGIAPNNQETGEYTMGLSNLVPNTTYYVRSYATTINGTGLGEIVSFTTSSNLTVPELTTTAASEIAYTSAKVGGRYYF